MLALKAAAVQLATLLVLFGVARLGLSPEFTDGQWVIAQGALAATFAVGLRQPSWWVCIHALFAPALWLASSLELPASGYGAAFALLLLIYWTPFRSQVPLFLSSRAAVAAVADWLPQCEDGLAIADIGCGTGRFVAALAGQRQDCHITGIELAPIPWLFAHWQGRLHGNVEIVRDDLWHQDWSHYDVIYAFLSPVPMPRVWEKCCAELKPGAWLISNSFAVPGVAPDHVIEVLDRRRTRLLCYQLPGVKH